MHVLCVIVHILNVCICECAEKSRQRVSRHAPRYVCGFAMKGSVLNNPNPNLVCISVCTDSPPAPARVCAHGPRFQVRCRCRTAAEL